MKIRFKLFRKKIYSRTFLIRHAMREEILCGNKQVVGLDKAKNRKQLKRNVNQCQLTQENGLHKSWFRQVLLYLCKN